MRGKNQRINTDPPESDNVVIFAAARRAPDRPPALSDDEILQLRALLQKATIIVAACPIAQRALQDANL